ncbi:hypothetical protein BN903_26 [Halorubrum sp. AJ67]|nr:hypothetical protein BN903_26 [Halorubrum sp. AJ67]
MPDSASRSSRRTGARRGLREIHSVRPFRRSHLSAAVGVDFGG